MPWLDQRKFNADPDGVGWRQPAWLRNITDVEQISKRRVRVRARTLYAALDRLRADGLIDVDCEEIVDNRLRRYYRLTPTGEKRLSEEADRLRSHARAATSRLDVSGGPKSSLASSER